MATTQIQLPKLTISSTDTRKSLTKTDIGEMKASTHGCDLGIYVLNTMHEGGARTKARVQRFENEIEALRR